MNPNRESDESRELKAGVGGFFLIEGVRYRVCAKMH